MPIDPSIVSNAFVNAANNMPDVNALMNQRVRGAENIYQIETARQEQAAQAEKEAAQQAAEAMLPAVASAFSDPSDAGLDAATSMLPPEVADAFAPFMQRLKGIGDTNQRMAILRAELAKDDEGRYILGQLEPTANMRMQEGTAARRAALDERRLALEEARLSAEAEGGGVSPDVAARLEFEREKLAAEAAKGTAEEVKKRLTDTKRAKDLDLVISEVEGIMQPGGLIDKATGSYLGNLVDTAFATFGASLEGSEAIARLAPVADLVLKMVPRFEGPQSNFDVQSYKDAAGNLANPNVPVSTKKAAADEIVRLFKKYRDQFEYAPDQGAAGGGGGQDTNGDGVIDFNDLD
jgi:hypothetical protein